MRASEDSWQGPCFIDRCRKPGSPLSRMRTRTRDPTRSCCQAAGSTSSLLRTPLAAGRATFSGTGTLTKAAAWENCCTISPSTHVVPCVVNSLAAKATSESVRSLCRIQSSKFFQRKCRCSVFGLPTTWGSGQSWKKQCHCSNPAKAFLNTLGSSEGGETPNPTVLSEVSGVGA